MEDKIKLKSFPVYLPEDVMNALNKISKEKRIAKTRIAEQELVKYIAREVAKNSNSVPFERDTFNPIGL